MNLTEKAPKIIDTVVEEGESTAFIPYPDLGESFENVPVYLRPDLFYYSARMGFKLNCNKLYMHVPWIAQHMIHLNNAIMRDERNNLSEHLKYRIALAVSRTNECPYCVSHHAGTLKRRWEYEDDDLENLLHLDPPTDEREAAAMEFATQASLDSAGVTDELRAKLAEHFSPQEVMEIVILVGFWKMYNLMHAAMAVPIEDPMAGLEKWMDVQPKASG
ncbi:MAG: carboxymuconolactone decarboxylase family protein [Gammaproteobacteria bacterium]|nr:carboxymuconolactone decarboxylase family protein [Gammaproteobacteria bacterium]